MTKQFEYLDSSSHIKAATSLELRELASEGLITKATSVREVGGKEWTKAGAIKGLEFSPAAQVERSYQGPVFHPLPKDDWERLAGWALVLSNIHMITGALMAGAGVLMIISAVNASTLGDRLVLLSIALGSIAGSVPVFCLATLLWAVELYAKGRSNA